MAKSFTLDDGGYADTGLTVVLLLVAGLLSIFGMKIYLPGLPVLHPAPLIVFFITRWAYKWHFRRLLRKRLAEAAELDHEQ